jgi:hypothetical protein
MNAGASKCDGLGEGGGGGLRVGRGGLGSMSEPDSLHLAQCNLVLCPVVELCSAGRFVSGHLLAMLKPSVVFQVNRDTGCSPSMTSDRSPLPDRGPGVVAVQRSSGHGRSSRINALEQGPPALETCGRMYSFRICSSR